MPPKRKHGKKEGSAPSRDLAECNNSAAPSQTQAHFTTAAEILTDEMKSYRSSVITMIGIFWLITIDFPLKTAFFVLASFVNFFGCPLYSRNLLTPDNRINQLINAVPLISVLLLHFHNFLKNSFYSIGIAYAFAVLSWLHFNSISILASKKAQMRSHLGGAISSSNYREFSRAFAWYTLDIDHLRKFNLINAFLMPVSSVAGIYFLTSNPFLCFNFFILLRSIDFNKIFRKRNSSSDGSGFAQAFNAKTFSLKLGIELVLFTKLREDILRILGDHFATIDELVGVNRLVTRLVDEQIKEAHVTERNNHITALINNRFVIVQWPIGGITFLGVKVPPDYVQAAVTKAADEMSLRSFQIASGFHKNGMMGVLIEIQTQENLTKGNAEALAARIHKELVAIREIFSNIELIKSIFSIKNEDIETGILNNGNKRSLIIFINKNALRDKPNDAKESLQKYFEDVFPVPLEDDTKQKIAFLVGNKKREPLQDEPAEASSAGSNTRAQDGGNTRAQERENYNALIFSMRGDKPVFQSGRNRSINKTDLDDDGEKKPAQKKPGSKIATVYQWTTLFGGNALNTAALPENVLLYWFKNAPERPLVVCWDRSLEAEGDITTLKNRLFSNNLTGKVLKYIVNVKVDGRNIDIYEVRTQCEGRILFASVVLEGQPPVLIPTVFCKHCDISADVFLAAKRGVDKAEKLTSDIMADHIAKTSANNEARSAPR
ncbi:MAG: hypothetical protein A3E84_00100 [Gammaproteobacteria bacterium RIFCSPHIGHO2_12_FULL_42_13]|nr:MAG: hypothetical protein A3E84_00100 [Gammaproteobacteria bacterium RIFCSPHIGHO2_12_FULL_42_13]